MPEYDMYQPDHPVRVESRRQLGSGDPCSWLYGVFVLNPNGSVSPCCAVPSEAHDFGEYVPGAFWRAWNGEAFRRARRLFRRTGSASPVDASHLNDGMGAKATGELGAGELICEKCPIPHLQDYIRPVLDEAAAELVHAIHTSPSRTGAALPLVSLFLMGSTYWRPYLDGRLRELRSSSASRGRRVLWFLDNGRKAVMRLALVR